MSKILIAAVLFLFLFSCKDACKKEYDFSVSFNINPSLKDTFRIGDTLWLSSEIPFKFQDKRSSSYIDITNFNFQIQCNLGRLDTSVFTYPVNSFKYINSIGKLNIVNINNEISYFKVEHQNEGTSKKLKVGLIPSKTGIYYLEFGYLTDNLNEAFNKVTLFDDKCVENFMINFDMNNSSDDFNFHLIKQSPQQITAFENYKRSGAYAFIVK